MSKLALSGLAVGVAMAIGTAQAEPLTLSADQMDQVTAAGDGYANFNANLYSNINTYKNEYISKYVNKNQYVYVQGFFGQADAFANCYDGAAYGCQAVTFSATDVDSYKGNVTSVSTSEAATSGFSIFYNGGTDP
jgi:hypothetical protein